VALREKQIRDAILSLRLDASRVTIIRGGFREAIFTEMWLSFDDAATPILTPTVDAKFVKVPVKTTKPRQRKK